ncbi:hypothetical protein FB107DRAFT_289775 [Schizophyllum commune]
MSSIPSEAISTCQSMRSPVVNHRLVALDEGAYRRQIEHFEYHWGMQKGELDLHSPLNHIQLREDMVSSLNDLEWILMPTKATLNAMYRMAEYNQSADIHSRKHFLTEFPEEEYEYDFVPLYYLKHRHALYVDRGSTVKPCRAPYRTLPRIRSRAHPFFVAFLADCQLDRCAAIVMPEAKARLLMRSVGRIVCCWMAEPPSEFLNGREAIWRTHRHPLSDDGRDTCPPLQNSTRGNDAPGVRTRSMTRAPCRQAKTRAAAPKPYARLNPRPARDRGSALPRPGRDSDDEDEQDSFWEPWAIREWRANILARAPQLPPDAKSRRDDMLARYRREPPRDARDALDPDNSNFCSSGLIIGNGVDWSGYSSNNWAKHIYNKCLMNRDPICLP